LHIACREKDDISGMLHNLARYLLSYGATINEYFHFGTNHQSPLYHAVDVKRLTTVRMLVHAGANDRYNCITRGWTVLEAAVRNIFLPDLIMFLLLNEVGNIDEIYQNGRMSALVFAVESLDVNAVWFLLAYAGEVNLQLPLVRSLWLYKCFHHTY
jgi:ankyrin repeat protein